MKNIFTLLLLCLGFSSYSQCLTNTSSLSFNGSSNYVSFNSNNGLAPDSAVSVEAWINATSWALNSYNGTIFCKHSWSSGEQGFVLRAGGSGQLSFILAGLDTLGVPTSWVELLSPTSAMVLNTWYHVAGTYDGDTMRLYINGARVAQIPLKGTMVPATAYPPAIGQLSDPNQFQSRYWNGKLDEIRVWDRAISDSEIVARYGDHLDPIVQTGLVGYWRFNENTGSITNDLSLSGNNGTLSGASWSTVVPFTNSAATPFVIPNGIVLTSTPASGYQWNLNGVPVLNATNQVYTAIANGNYTVTITDSLGCTATSAGYIVTGVGVGIDEINTTENYKIERSSTMITIVSAKSILKDLIITDVTGRYIMDQNGNGSNSIAVDVSTLQLGVYIFLITDVNAHMKSVRILLE